MKILICGFMGAGKTTLVDKMGENALDLDEYLTHNSEVRCFDTIAGFIEISGLDSFRHLEFMAIKDHLDQKKPDEDLIIALGGGTLENQEVRDLFEEEKDLKLVWVDTDFETCFSRIDGDVSRPLANGKTKAELRSLYDSRLSFYKTADLILKPEDLKKLHKFEDLKQALYT